MNDEPTPCRAESRDPLEFLSFQHSLDADRDAFWVLGSDGLQESCARWGSRGAEGRCHGNHFLALYIWGAHWRHLANTTEPSMCGSDAALC